MKGIANPRTGFDAVEDATGNLLDEARTGRDDRVLVRGALLAIAEIVGVD